MIFVNFYTGIKSFSTNKNTVLKWCLNRRTQSKNTSALKVVCGVGMDPGMYKPIRASQITKFERDVQKILRVLVEDYINPFGLDVENEYLVSMSSGKLLVMKLPIASCLYRNKEEYSTGNLLKSVSNWEPYHSTILLKRIASSFSMMILQDKEVPKK